MVYQFRILVHFFIVPPLDRCINKVLCEVRGTVSFVVSYRYPKRLFSLEVLRKPSYTGTVIFRSSLRRWDSSLVVSCDTVITPLLSSESSTAATMITPSYFGFKNVWSLFKRHEPTIPLFRISHWLSYSQLQPRLKCFGAVILSALLRVLRGCRSNPPVFTITVLVANIVMEVLICWYVFLKKQLFNRETLIQPSTRYR